MDPRSSVNSTSSSTPIPANSAATPKQPDEKAELQARMKKITDAIASPLPSAAPPVPTSTHRRVERAPRFEPLEPHPDTGAVLRLADFGLEPPPHEGPVGKPSEFIPTTLAAAVSPHSHPGVRVTGSVGGSFFPPSPSPEKYDPIVNETGSFNNFLKKSLNDQLDQPRTLQAPQGIMQKFSSAIFGPEKPPLPLKALSADISPQQMRANIEEVYTNLTSEEPSKLFILLGSDLRIVPSSGRETHVRSLIISPESRLAAIRALLNVGSLVAQAIGAGDRPTLEFAQNFLAVFIKSFWFTALKSYLPGVEGQVLSFIENLQKYHKRIAQEAPPVAATLGSSSTSSLDGSYVLVPGMIVEPMISPIPEGISQTMKITLRRLNTWVEHNIGLIKDARSVGKGVHGAVFVAGKDGKLGVVKEAEDRQPARDIFTQRGRFLSPIRDKDPLVLGENAAYILSEILEFHVVPETAVVLVCQDDRTLRPASFQAFAQGYSLAPPVIRSRLNGVSPLSESEVTLFQKMACFDFILGNIDRHGENWMAQVDATGRMTDIKMIDNGSSFPRHHMIEGTGKDLLREYAALNQYNWATYGSALLPFTPEMVAHIRSLNPDSLEEVFRSFDLMHPGYFTPEMKQLARDRLKILIRVADEPPIQVRHIDGTVRPFTLQDLYLFIDKENCNRVMRGENVVVWTPTIKSEFEACLAKNKAKGRG